MGIVANVDSGFLTLQNIFLSARDHVKVGMGGELVLGIPADTHLLLQLGDFGIAKVLSLNDTHTATMVGTPYYLSPEICLGRPYGAPSDCCERSGRKGI